MARPSKIGLNYFPLDVNIDDNLELIEAEHGLSGFAIVVKLWQRIYSNGYYLEWSEDSSLLFSRKINSELILVNSVINSCFRRNIFDEKLYSKYKILTSSGIQKRYLTACSQSKRKSIVFIEPYLLVNSEFTGIITEFIQLNQEESTQSKVKKSKVEETKENTWRTDFEVYKSELFNWFETIKADSEFLSEQEKFNPGIDVLLSIEKSIKVFWGTEAGWKNKKSSKTVNIDWKSTIAKNLDKNKVYKQNAKTINHHDKLASNRQAAAELAAEIAEKSRNFVEQNQRAGTAFADFEP